MTQLLGVIGQEFAQASLAVNELDALGHVRRHRFSVLMGDLAARQIAGVDTVHDCLLDARALRTLQQMVA